MIKVHEGLAVTDFLFTNIPWLWSRRKNGVSSLASRMHGSTFTSKGGMTIKLLYSSDKSVLSSTPTMFLYPDRTVSLRLIFLLVYPLLWLAGHVFNVENLSDILGRTNGSSLYLRLLRSTCHPILIICYPSSR